ncbi:MAG: hypothetical protein JSV37_04260 [Anaerolineaceae bacterium]|nr:MAG: hypothetical protein JSV37_04260 [Anaerolineaceae bacterium]
MLNQILTEIENSPRGLCLEEIAQRLDKDPGVVAGGLDLLVHMGKLDQIENSMCDVCPVRGMCNVISDTAKIFFLAETKNVLNPSKE